MKQLKANENHKLCGKYSEYTIKKVDIFSISTTKRNKYLDNYMTIV